MVTDLFEDIKDGVRLLALLEVLSGQKLVSFTVFCTACDLATDFKHSTSSDLSGLNFNLIVYDKVQTQQISHL